MKRSVLALIAISVFAACTDERGPTSGPQKLAAEISDALHGSSRNLHFFLLPPMVSAPTTFNGPFNPRLSPVVQICDQQLTPCPAGHEHARFTTTSGPGAQTVHLGDQQYIVDWNTSAATEPVGTSYRITVLVHGQALGFADVDIVGTGRAKNANTGDDIALVDGRTLPIKFRIEEGAIAASCGTTLDCAEGTGSPTLSTTIKTLGDGAGNQAGTLIPAGALSQVVTVTIRRNLARPCIPPPFDLPQYQGCYDFFTDPGPTLFNSGPGVDPVIVGMCIETDLGSSTGRNAQIAQFDVGQPVRILPQAPATFLGCEDPFEEHGETGSRGAPLGRLLAVARAGAKAVLRALLPQRLVAAHIGIGGTPPGYSTFTWTLPVTIAKNGGDAQSAPPGTAVAINPSVIARDSSDNPAQGVIVHFHALQGAVADTVDTTDVNGIATPGTWTLGSSVGQNSLVATSVGAVGSPLVFTATAMEVIGSWTGTGSMSGGRRDHTATLVGNDHVLIVGGTAAGALLYDTIARTFSPTTGAPQFNHGQGATATLLPDGRVLIVGGSVAAFDAETYDPGLGLFVPLELGPAASREFHTATLLLDGRVLLAGGQSHVTGGEQTHNQAEIYDPVTDAFTPTGSLNVDRGGHSATLLPDGRVLIVGGIQTTAPSSGNCLTSAEIYDPSTGTFSVSGSMQDARCDPGASLLGTGRVLVIGWLVSSAELFNPTTGTFSSTGSMSSPHASGTTTLLSDGRVLVAGGFTATGPVTTSTAEVYNPALGTFAPAASMSFRRQEHTATLLLFGQVLLVGGTDGTSELASAELFTLPSPTP